MHDIIKKSLKLGVDTYVKTRKEIEGTVKDLVKKNHLNKKEGEILLAKTLAQSKKIEKKVEAQVRQSLLAAVKTLQGVTKKDLALLEKKLKGAKRK